MDCQGITEVTAADIAAAKDAGYVIKLLAIAEKLGNGVSVRVHPTLIPREHPLGAVRGAFNTGFRAPSLQQRYFTNSSTQFTSGEYQRFLSEHNIISSMSAVGHCGDNAAAEGFFGMLKRERVYRRSYQTMAQARSDVFDYIERHHNPRMQRRLDNREQQFIALTQQSA